VNWLKTNWKSIMPLIAALLTIVGTVAGVKFTLKSGPEAEVIIIVPSEGEQVIQAGARDHRPVLLAIARARAGARYAKDNDLDRSVGVALARAVPQADIEAEMKKAGLSFADVPIGGPLQGLLDWLAAHPEFLEKLVQLLLVLIPLFA